MTIVEQIKQITKKTRQWADRTLAEEYGEELARTCAICSAELFRRLREANISAEIVVSDFSWGSHCYVVSNGYLLDITATQFSKQHPPVTIVEFDKREQKEYWGVSKRFRSSRGLRLFQQKTGWPEDQLAK